MAVNAISTDDDDWSFGITKKWRRGRRRRRLKREKETCQEFDDVQLAIVIMQRRWFVTLWPIASWFHGQIAADGPQQRCLQRFPPIYNSFRIIIVIRSIQSSFTATHLPQLTRLLVNVELLTDPPVKSIHQSLDEPPVWVQAEIR